MVEAKDLGEHLELIETKLGGDKKPLIDLGAHLEYIESLIGGSSGDGVTDVKVNGSSVVEDKVANIDLSNYASRQYVDDNKGTKLYKHTILLSFIDYDEEPHQYNFKIVCITNSNTNIGGYIKYLVNAISLIQVSDLDYETQEPSYYPSLVWEEGGNFEYIQLDGSSAIYEIQTILSETETITEL